MVTDEQLREWAEAAAKATPGPWTAKREPYMPAHEVHADAADVTVALHLQAHDARFVCAARDAFPALLAEVAAQAAEIARLRAEVTAWKNAVNLAGPSGDPSDSTPAMAEAYRATTEYVVDTAVTALRDTGDTMLLSAALGTYRAEYDPDSRAITVNRVGQRLAEATARAETAEAAAGAMRSALVLAGAVLVACAGDSHNATLSEAYDAVDAALAPDAGKRVADILAAAERIADDDGLTRPLDTSVLELVRAVIAWRRGGA